MNSICLVVEPILRGPGILRRSAAMALAHGRRAAHAVLAKSNGGHQSRRGGLEVVQGGESRAAGLPLPRIGPFRGA